MENEYKTIVGITKEKAGRISIKNKGDFLNNLDYCFERDEIDESLLIDFKSEVFNKLQPDEWFYIELSEEDIVAIDNKIRLPRTKLKKEEINSLQHIVYFVSENNSCVRCNLERITNKKIGTPHILLTPARGNNFKYKKANNNDIQINGEIRIKYYKDKKQLYFKKHPELKGIFDISSIFEKATLKEVEEFTDYSIIDFTKKFKVGDRNKQKIKMILEKKESYLSDSSKKEALKTYAQKYNLSVFNNNDILDVASNKQLTDIVDLLLENFNEDPISKEKIRIQSKTTYKLSQKK